MALRFLSGPPGVGKSTVGRRLFERLPSVAWLDGDDVWRIRPFVVNDTTRAQVEGNIVAVMRGHLEAGFDEALLTWVLHRQDLVDRLAEGIGVVPHVVALVCRPETLEERLDRRGDLRLLDHALRRLEQVRATHSVHVPTDGRDVESIATDVLHAWGWPT